MGFLASLATVVLSGTSGFILLGAVGYFGWIGLFASTTIILCPLLLVLYLRERNSCMYSDDKLGWARQKEALDRYVKEVTGKE